MEEELPYEALLLEFWSVECFWVFDCFCYYKRILKLEELNVRRGCMQVQKVSKVLDVIDRHEVA